MKKFWKVFLLSLLAIILVASGLAYYFLKVKTYETADAEVEEITESEYEIVLPEEEVEEGANEESEETNSDQKESTGNEGTESNQSSSNTASNSNNDKEDQKQSSGSGDQTGSTSTEHSTQVKEDTVTVAEIKDKYRPSFQNLQDQANGKIDSLVSKAFTEYKTKKENGEKISLGYFYNKYTNAADALEGKTDTAFNTIYKALQKDLKKHGYSTSHAKEFKEHYENEKSSRRTALLNKAVDNF